MNEKTKESKWWVKVLTNEPGCIYYFGDFDSYSEANVSMAGYIQDLREEGAVIVSCKVEKCQPEYLTIEKKDKCLDKLNGSKNIAEDNKAIAKSNLV